MASLPPLPLAGPQLALDLLNVSGRERIAEFFAVDFARFRRSGCGLLRLCDLSIPRRRAAGRQPRSAP